MWPPGCISSTIRVDSSLHWRRCHWSHEVNYTELNWTALACTGLNRTGLELWHIHQGFLTIMRYTNLRTHSPTERTVTQ